MFTLVNLNSCESDVVQSSSQSITSVRGSIRTVGRNTSFSRSPPNVSGKFSVTASFPKNNATKNHHLRPAVRGPVVSRPVCRSRHRWRIHAPSFPLVAVRRNSYRFDSIEQFRAIGVAKYKHAPSRTRHLENTSAPRDLFPSTKALRPIKHAASLGSQLVPDVQRRLPGQHR